MFDFPEAFGPNNPTVFKTGTPFHSITLWLSSLARAVLMLAALKSIRTLSRIEKKLGQ